MKTTLQNGTGFRTADLRALVNAALLATGFPLRTRPLLYSACRLRIEIRSSRGGVHGQAVLGRSARLPGLWMRLHLPPRRLWTDDTWRRIVAVTVHECMHLVGATHGSMTPTQRDCTGPLPDWALPLELRETDP